MKDFRGMKRQRSRNRKPSGNQNNPNRAYESNGPEGTKVRGNAQTIYEKYQQLARDANSAGDRVLAENHLQHAEHYFRMIRQMQPTRPVSEFVQRDPFSNGFDDYDDEMEAEAAEAEEAASTNEESQSGYDDQPRYDNRDRDNGNRMGGNRDRDRSNGNRDRDRSNNDRNRDDRQPRFEPRNANGENRNNESRPDNRNADNRNANRDAQADDNGNGERRETRRERYERRRQQRFAEQESNLNGQPAPATGDNEPPYIAPAFIASTQPLGVPRPVQDTPPQSELGFEAPAAEAPVVKTRAPRKERVRDVPAADQSHLPAFLSRPTPVAVEAAAPAAAEDVKPKRTRKRKEDAAAEEA